MFFSFVILSFSESVCHFFHQLFIYNLWCQAPSFHSMNIFQVLGQAVKLKYMLIIGSFEILGLLLTVEHQHEGSIVFTK